MESLAPARETTLARILVMPQPGPLGRLVKRLRKARGWEQEDLTAAAEEWLAVLTENPDAQIRQSLISRIETGRTQRINDPMIVTAIGKALGFKSPVTEAEFVLAAWMPSALDKIRIVPVTGEPNFLADLDPEDRAYIERYLSYPPEYKQRVRRAIDFVRDEMRSGEHNSTVKKS